MTLEAMETHTIGNNSFAVFSKEEKGGVWILQFIWGKKDFRIYLGRHVTRKNTDYQGPLLRSEKNEEVMITNLQYLYAFEWFDYKGVAGHGLAYEEVCWAKAGNRRYVELPKDFYNIAVDLACTVFDLQLEKQRIAS